MIELRRVITPDLSRLAVKRGRPELGPVLRSILKEMRADEIDDGELQELTDEFWMVLAKNSGNIAYRLILNTVTEVRRVSQEFLASAIPSQYRTLTHLERIVEAVDAGDPDAAFQAAQERSEMMASGLRTSVPSTKGPATKVPSSS
jgi:DNA-binding FadR family transcriptional regulator